MWNGLVQIQGFHLWGKFYFIACPNYYAEEVAISPMGTTIKTSQRFSTHLKIHFITVFNAFYDILCTSHLGDHTR